MKKICVSELLAISSGLDELYLSCQKAHQALSKLESAHGKLADDTFHFPQCRATFPVKASDADLLLSYLKRDNRGRFNISIGKERIYREHGESNQFTEKLTLVAIVKQ